MAKKAKKSVIRKYLSNKRLISLEAVLLVGFLENYVENLVTQSSFAAPIKTLFIMLLIAGAFGVLMALVISLTKQSLHGAKKAVDALPLPTPFILIHSCAILGIYSLYSMYWS